MGSGKPIHALCFVSVLRPVSSLACLTALSQIPFKAAFKCTPWAKGFSKQNKSITTTTTKKNRQRQINKKTSKSKMFWGVFFAFFPSAFDSVLQETDLGQKVYR